MKFNTRIAYKILQSTLFASKYNSPQMKIIKGIIYLYISCEYIHQ